MATEFKPGDEIMAYFTDKWQAAKLIEVGRKWATVHINGRARNSRISVSAMRHMPVAAKPAPPEPQAPSVTGNAKSIHVDEFDSYIRLFDGPVVICAIPKARRAYADELLAALKAWRQLKAQPGPVTGSPPGETTVQTPQNPSECKFSPEIRDKISTVQ